MTFITTIDTLKFSDRMQKAGLSKKAADELAEAMKEMQTNSIENLVTKQDLQTALELNKKDIIIKLGSIMAAGVGIIAILIKF